MKQNRWVGVATVFAMLTIVAASQVHAPQKAGSGVGMTPPSFAGVLTWQNDNMRDGQNLNETILTPANVQTGGFGPAFSFPVDGFIWAEPLYVPREDVAGLGIKNVVYVATAHDSVFAFDADGFTSTPLWQTSFINPAQGITTLPASVINCPNGPEYGITATPVIDPVRGVMYVTGTIYNTTTRQASFVLHELSLETGEDVGASPVTVTAQYAGIKMQPLQLNSRPALLLASGKIYLAYASNCDAPPFNGWVLAYNATTLAQTAVFLVTPSGQAGGIWMSGAGLSADVNGDVYFSTGNGTFDASVGGQDYGDSLLRVNPTLQVMSYFTPFNEQQDQLLDLDVGSAGHVLLPDQQGAVVHELVTGSKAGTVYVLNRDALGGFHRSGDDVVQELPVVVPFGIYSSFGYWNNNVYVAGTSSKLAQFPLNNGMLGSPIVADIKYPYPGATPSISANNTANGIIWTMINRANNAVLHASLASNVTQDLYDSGSALPEKGVKFTVPMVANGRVYLGTQTELVVFGLP